MSSAFPACSSISPSTACARSSNEIRFVVPRHEQTAAYMADGYARTTGRIGTCMVVPGPGLLNAAAGLATAYACNSPVLAIVGTIHSAAIGRGYGLLHEIKNQSGVLAAVTKWNALARSPQAVPGLVRQAVAQLHEGRKQPVGIEIPPDVLSARAEIDLHAGAGGRRPTLAAESGGDRAGRGASRSEPVSGRLCRRRRARQRGPRRRCRASPNGCRRRW